MWNNNFLIQRLNYSFLPFSLHFQVWTKKLYILFKPEMFFFSQNQGILIETIQQENAKYAECQSAKNLLVMVCWYVCTGYDVLEDSWIIGISLNGGMDICAVFWERHATLVGSIKGYWKTVKGTWLKFLWT